MSTEASIFWEVWKKRCEKQNEEIIEDLAMVVLVVDSLVAVMGVVSLTVDLMPELKRMEQERRNRRIEI